jgi:hypothetical protein
VQRCKSELSSCAKVQKWEASIGWREIISGLRVGLTILGRPRSSKDARPYPMHKALDTISGLRSRPAGPRYRLSGSGTGAGLNLVLNT